MLSAAEEQALIERAQAGDRRARDRLIMSFRPLVEREVRRVFRRSSATLEDEVQEGLVGLLKALDKFDPSRGFRFSTYARFWVVAEVMNYANTRRNVVHAPNSIAAKRVMAHLGRAKTAEQQRDPGATEREALERACARLGVSIEVATAVNAVRSVKSLDIKIVDGDEDSASLVDMLADPNDYFAAAEEEEEQAYRARLLRDAAQELPPRTREIFDARLDKMTFRDIGFVFDISVERTRQIYTRAVERVADIVARMNPQPQPSEVR